MINKLLQIRPVWLLIIYILADIICVGMGMGVPIFCILFGFIVGYLVVRFVALKNNDLPQVMHKTFITALITASVTFLAMLALWMPFTASYLFDPAKDLANTGIPMILFEPRASFIGWVVLMVFISPFLQLLTTLFGAYLTLLGWLNKAPNDKKAI